MKTKLLILTLLFCSYLLKAQNGLEKIFVERYYVADAIDAANSHPAIPIGAVTYRIYADMLPGYKVQTIYAEQSVSGSPAHPMTLTTTTYFWNQEDYGASIPTFGSNNAKKNTVMLDSWLSTGGACNGFNGVPKSEDNGVGNFVNSNVPQLLQNNAAQAGIPLTTQDGMFAGTVPTAGTLGIDPAMLDLFSDGSANGNTFLVTDGSWYCLAGAPGPIPATNRVLIAQITTDGVFHFELNIQIGTPSGGTEKYVHSNPTGVELSIPSLIQTLYPVPTAPAVSITAPANNSTFSIGTPVTITADASDEGFIAQVEFFVDGVSIGIDASAPYEASYTGNTDASHILTAVATDNEGLITTSDPVNFNILQPATKTLTIKAFIQGYWNGTSMNQVQDVDNDLNSFNKFSGTTVDTLSVLLADALTPFGFVFEAHNVNINPDGTMSITVPASFSGNYYIVIKQRNTLETWSANAVSFSGGTINYDFTNSALQAYGSNQYDLNGDGTLWGLYSGDFTSSTSGVKDEYVDFFDLNEIFNLNLVSAFGFQTADITGDGFVDFFDVNMAYNNNLISVGQNTPPNPAKRPNPNAGGTSPK